MNGLYLEQAMPGSVKSVGYSISTIKLLLCDLWVPWEPSSSRYLLSWRQQDIEILSDIITIRFFQSIPCC